MLHTAHEIASQKQQQRYNQRKSIFWEMWADLITCLPVASNDSAIKKKTPNLSNKHYSKELFCFN